MRIQSGWRGFVGSVVATMGVIASATCFSAVFGAGTALAAGKPKPAPAPQDPDGPNDRNWVALHIWDTIYPMLEEQSFPEAISSLEIIEQLFAQRNLNRSIKKAFGGGKKDFGDRSGAGHYMMWIHLSDRYLEKYPIDRERFGEYRFMFKDRETDIFSAWGGGTNTVALLRSGIQGLGVPIFYPEPGKFEGEFQGFDEAVRQGEADYEGGWYISDEQAFRVLEAFSTYPGIEKGYSFLRPIEEKPNAPYEPASAQLGNGWNCGDFAYYALTTAGVVPKDEVEALKIRLWYPEKYFDAPIPLDGTGKRGGKWLAKNPDATFFPENVMTRIAWSELLFSPTGVTFFDKAEVAEAIRSEWPRVRGARIWEHEHAIEWLAATADFHSKGVMTELKPAMEAGIRIVSPVRTVAPSPENRFRLSGEYSRLRRKGDRMYRRKLERAGIADSIEEFRILFDSLKIHD